MIVTEARIAANRRNSLKSTGPKTPEGKVISRANALKHGLCASVLVVEDAKLVRQRSLEFFTALRPQDDFQAWLVTEIALGSIKIDRAERMDRRVRDKVAMRAELCWDDDRRLEASLLGERLGERPEVVVDQLRKTLHGCEWLMGRWALLAHAADVQEGGWTPAQARLAFDLLATPGEFRQGHKPGASIDFEGRVLDDPAGPSAVARREIAALKERRDQVEALDEANRALAEADLNDDSDAELKRLRKYEGTLHSRLRWCFRQLRAEGPPRETPRWVRAAWLGSEDLPPPPATLPKPAPVPEPSPEVPAARFPDLYPDFDPKPEELPPIGQPVDIPMLMANRRRKQLKKAEARRQAKRRKVEDLRA